MRCPDPIRSFLVVALSLLGPLLITTCGGDGGTDPVDPSVSLSPTTASLYVGDQVSLTATVTGTSGSASFSSSAPGVATVDASGMVTGVSPGNATITASAGGAAATALITVDPSSISVGPQGPSILPEETVQLTATITGGSGHTVTWTSGDEEVATVDGTGLVTAVGPGSTSITASVDGQAGVEASANIEVLTPAPEVEFVSFEDDTGAPLDLEDVSGVFVINAEVTGYVGTQANLEIFFDEELYETVPFTVEAPGASSGESGPPSLSPRVTQDIPVSVSTISVEELGQGRVGVRLEDALHSLSGVVVHNGARSNVPIRGVGNSVNITTDNPLVGVVRTTPAGQTLMVDGKTYTNGDVNYEVAIASPHPFDLDRIELLRGPQGFMYEGNVAAGVGNFVAARSNHEGFEGPTFTQEIKVFDTGGLFENAYIANNSPEIFGYLNLDQYSHIDYRGPSFTSTPVATGNLVFGANTDIQAYMDLWTGFGTGEVFDATGITKFLWQFRIPPDDWDPTQNHQFGIDLSPTDGFTLNPSFYAEDGFGQGSRSLVGDGTGGFRNVAVDLTAPTQMLAPGGFNIADMGLYGTTGDWRIQLDTNDPPFGGFTWSSGVDPTAFDFRLRFRSPTADEYQFGDAGGLERVSFNLTLGWSIPLGPGGEWFADVQTNDLAGNGSGIYSFSFLYDPTVPVIGAPTFTGLTDNVFAAGTDIGVQFNAMEDVETRLAAAAAYNPTGQIYYFNQFYPVGTAFDGQFASNTDLDLTIRDFVPRLEFTGGPRFSNGWYAFNWAGGGAVNTAGGYSSNFVDITSQLPPAGQTFAQSQLESWFPDQTLTQLCLEAGPQCNGKPTSATVSARGWVPDADGYPQFQEGQLLAMKYGPGGVEMFRPLGDPVPVTIQPFGGFGHEVQLSKVISIDQDALTEYYVGFAWGLKNAVGDLYVTETWTADIRIHW